MTRKRSAILLSGACLALAGVALADQARCPVVSGGAETTLPGTYGNLGQVVIGRSSNATTVAHAGALACLRVHTACLPGDVNGDGLVDGQDIGGFTKVKITGVGTPRELCAAAISIPSFVTLLLGP